MSRRHPLNGASGMSNILLMRRLRDEASTYQLSFSGTNAKVWACNLSKTAHTSTDPTTKKQVSAKATPNSLFEKLPHDSLRNAQNPMTIEPECSCFSKTETETQRNESLETRLVGIVQETQRTHSEKTIFAKSTSKGLFTRPPQNSEPPWFFIS